MVIDSRYEVIILAGGECKRLYPLTSGGVVKALLPVGNRPLIWYPLRHLAEAGIKSATVVAIGEAVASRIQAYLQQQAAGGGVACKVRAAPAVVPLPLRRSFHACCDRRPLATAFALHSATTATRQAPPTQPDQTNPTRQTHLNPGRSSPSARSATPPTPCAPSPPTSTPARTTS